MKCSAARWKTASGPNAPTVRRSAGCLMSPSTTVSLPDGMANGTYVMSWRVISADGHPVAGSVLFSVGAASAGVREASQATR